MNKAVQDLADAQGLRLVATNGVSYADARRTRGARCFYLYPQPHAPRSRRAVLEQNSERYLKSDRTDARVVLDLAGSDLQHPRIAERLDFSLEDLGYEFPRYPTPDGESMEKFSRSSDLGRGAGALSARIFRRRCRSSCAKSWTYLQAWALPGIS